MFLQSTFHYDKSVDYEDSFQSSVTRGKSDWWSIIMDHWENTTQCIYFFQVFRAKERIDMELNAKDQKQEQNTEQKTSSDTWHQLNF